jgi:hypothetical protein
MKVKKFTCGITFFVTPEMYQGLKQLSDEKQIAVSELLRDWIADAFQQRRLKPESLPGDTGGEAVERKDRKNGTFA